jgi:hypothetical protein
MIAVFPSSMFFEPQNVGPFDSSDKECGKEEDDGSADK